MFDASSLAPPLRPFPQSEAYATAARACGTGAVRVDLGCAEALVLRRRGLQMVLRGPVWDAGTPPADRRRALRRLARWPGATLVTPEDPLSGLGLIPLVTPLHHAVWDLSGDLRAGLSGKWRNRMAVAECAGLRIGRGTSRTLEALIAAEAPQQQARGYRAHPPAFTRALPAASLRVFDWRHAGTLGAGMAFVVEGGTATYHLGWGGEAARAAHVHPLMLFRAALALRDEGVRWLDLGSVDTERAPGLARFKLGTGAELRKLGQTLLILPA